MTASRNVDMPAAEPAAAEDIHWAPSPLARPHQLAQLFAATAAARDKAGGTPKVERDRIRASGLLGLAVPVRHRGLGASWSDVLFAVREIARADGSLAHVFGFHHLMLATLRLFGQPRQWERWYERTVRERWFWGNALNPLDTRTTARQVDGGWEFSGRKRFCSGARDSEMLVVSGLDAHDGRLLVAVMPTGRPGITVHEDWDNFGQRQTDSGSVSFDAVRASDDELLTDPGPLSTPFACLRPVLAQLIFANVFLGIAEGAFEQARDYTLHAARPWSRSPATRAADDPYVLARYGHMWVALESVRLLTERAGQVFDGAWAAGDRLDAAGRGKAAVAVATAKAAATETGLELASRLFEVTGARATQGELGLDRFWRNLRTLTLHDPVDYKFKELGDWALNRALPTPSFYS